MPAQKALTVLEGPYTLVFLDPPYDDPQTLPFALELAQSALVCDETLVTLEHSVRNDAPDELGDFRVVRERRYGDTVVTLYSKGGPS
jgi:16S rRNA (guanine966-N2)-methyltransferase